MKNKTREEGDEGGMRGGKKKRGAIGTGKKEQNRD